MKKLITIIIILITAGSYEGVNLKRESVAGIKLDDPEAVVYQKFGQPTQKTELEYFECCDYYYQRLNYTKLGLEFGIYRKNIKKSGKVHDIYAKDNSNAKTSKEVGIGSTKDEIRESYGEYEEGYEEPVWTYIYSKKYDFIMLHFIFTDDKVTAIKFGYHDD